DLLSTVNLPFDLALRYPHQVSGGQCQRAAIARAIAIHPQLVVCDEATSALDVTVQMQIITLLKKLQKERGVSYLFISHDLALVQAMCARAAVMRQGKIVEQGSISEVIKHPGSEYTRTLINSAV
ncbi:ABC transporter ATP-binding protein, partial [Muricomes intestini]|uniref:ABC transporter ATP-binding protein n=1 Tax=Muricomes intestini TaxID=1796634 RepID=UPI002FE3D246